MATIADFFDHPRIVFGAAAFLRISLFTYGIWQDSFSPVKYTDVDYLVFTDAARFIANGRSPYDRATYRYTPLLAWLLHPTSWTTKHLGNNVWFEFGKVLFAAGDLATGWFIVQILVERKGMSVNRAMKYASLWLLNPMVANISTRGSSEGLVAVIVVALLWAALQKRIMLAGALLGLGVHFKIYPFIYAASIWWWLGSNEETTEKQRPADIWTRSKAFFTNDRIALARASFNSFMVLNIAMYYFYGAPFFEHSYRYHFTRIDHRHNFSIYNTLLHLNSAQGSNSGFQIESLAFLPQIVLSVGIIPYFLAKKDLASTMLAQTFAFVTFNKVCTSQYFLWYMVFLPFYLPSSSLLRKPWLGITALVLWIISQVLWLHQGYELEFLGNSTFVPGLWLSSIVFFAVNCWILGIIISDIGSKPDEEVVIPAPSEIKSE